MDDYTMHVNLRIKDRKAEQNYQPYKSATQRKLNSSNAAGPIISLEFKVMS